MKLKHMLLMLSVYLFTAAAGACVPKLNISGLGRLVFVVERENARLAVVDLESLKVIRKIKLSGNLRHASMVFDPALRYGYIASRDGVLIRVDLLGLKEAGVLKTSKNSIGLAISQDGNTIAVSEYQPGGVTFVDAKSFKVMNRLKAFVNVSDKKIQSRVTGLVDGPENTFIASLMDGNEIWIMSPSDDERAYRISRRIKAAAFNPFDGLITPEGRYYISAHINSDLLSAVDLWENKSVARKISLGLRRDKRSVQVKMPHLEAWAAAGQNIYIPHVGRKELVVLDRDTLTRRNTVFLIGDPVYGVVHPNEKEVWVSFSGDKDDGKIQVIDTRTQETLRVLNIGKRIYHLVFTPRGARALVSSNESNELIVVNALDYTVEGRVPVDSPSGIFGVWRAFETGL